MAAVETFVAFASGPFLGEFCFFHGIVLLGGAVGCHVLFVGVCRFAAGKAADSEYAGGNCFPDAAVQAGLVVLMSVFSCHSRRLQLLYLYSLSCMPFGRLTIVSCDICGDL